MVLRYLCAHGRGLRVQLLTLLATPLLLPLSACAEDPELSGALEVGVGEYLTGERDSSQFNEYREIPQGLFGGGDISYRDKQGYHAAARAQDIAEDDQEYSLSGGRYGVAELELEYSEIPHNYAYDAQSLYAGVGNDELRLSDSLEADVADSTSLVDVANTLTAAEQSAFITDLSTDRRRGRATLEVEALDPFRFLVEVKQDHRDGTRPLGAGFGFNNVTEIVEPRDWRTTEYKLSGEYVTKELYLSLGYYASIFDNNSDALSWDNPFRTSDSTSPNAYLSPLAGPTGLATAGPATGLYDLTPDNYYQNVSLNGVVRELPLLSQLTFNGSWGWMNQDDDLQAYTSNTAITPAADAEIPLNAALRSSLPVEAVDAKVNTQLYNLALTSHPLSYLDTKLRYRYYEWQNDSTEIRFPGYVRFDSSWENAPIATEPISYKKHTATADFDFDVIEDTGLGVGYRYERMDREHRETDAVDDHVIKLAVDNKSFEEVLLKVSYEHSRRRIDGNYDPSVPFGGEENIPQQPLLRKYDQADRDRDMVKLLATYMPLEALGITGSYTLGLSDYTHSDFGLQSDDFSVYALDADYTLSETAHAFVFYSYENHESEQRDRQWSAGGLGDPFYAEPGVESNSNWSAQITDDVHSVGFGFEFVVWPERVALKASYTLSFADGSAELASPLGTAANDANPFDPQDFSDVADTRIHTLNPEVLVTLTKSLTWSIGYLWEKYDIDDYNLEGFKYVPTTGLGAYNGALLLGTTPGDYEVNWAYTRLRYRF